MKKNGIFGRYFLYLRLKRIIRNEIQFKLKMGLKDSVIKSAESDLNKSRHDLSAGLIDIDLFDDVKAEKVKTTKAEFKIVTMAFLVKN